MNDLGPALLERLRNPDKDVRQDAAIALGELADPALAQALCEQLWNEPDFYVRETLTWALTQVAAAARPFVVEALSDPRSDVRVQALHVLSKFIDAEVVEDVIPLLDDSDEPVAAKARWTLSRIGDARALPHFLPLMGRGDAETRNGLTTTLAAFGETAVPATTAALASPEAEVRRHAADVLCHIGAPAAEPAAPALGALVADQDEDTAISAVMALGELDGEHAESHLRALSASDQDPLGRVALRALEKRRKRQLREARLRAVRP